MNKLLLIIILILIFDFILERVLVVLNTLYRKNPLPQELEGVYDAETYAKSVKYKIDSDKVGWVSAIITFVITLGMFVFGGFAWADNYLRHFTESPYILPLLFFGVLMLASDILDTPIDLYATFVIEEKYGFNKTTPKTYILDKLKGYLLTIILGGGLMALFIWFYQKTGLYFWLYAWGAFTAFMVFMFMFYSNLIVPLFNKQTPLEDGELRDAITDFGAKVGFKIDNIFVIDGSKRSTKANAYFTGLGPKKRIVLYDTLIKQLSTREIVAVLAHEIGHYKKKHTVVGLFTGILQTGLTLFILSLFINNPAFTQALGVNKPAIHIGLIAFGILYSPISTIIGLGMNSISRTNEYQADGFVKTFSLSDDLINALKKLSVNNLSNINPHPAYVFFHYSHPTLLQRIKALMK
jgi:STE24 endopeptidase